MASESAPLLPSSENSTSQGSFPQKYKLTTHWHSPVSPFAKSSFATVRQRVRHFLTSRWGHYFVLALVGIDVACILASFLISIFQCERKCKESHGIDDESEALDSAGEVFEVVSLVISCLFMAELLTSLWAFGLRYLTSWFHILDATVIIAAFVVDVCLKGIIEEAGSVIVVLRLWRVFKLIEELGAGAEEQTDDLNEHIERLMEENKELRRRLAASSQISDD